MNPIHIHQLAEKEVFPGYHGRFIHGSRLTIAMWEIEAGAPVPTHQHPHEQIVQVHEGVLQLTVDGVVHELRAGMAFVIPPNVPHTAVALTPCKVTDTFSPVREDYR
ncbi:MAG: cupin [Saprospiraceae bacterium]|nr:MAG: cupin [Saprospiraceae bacterium]